MESANKRKKAKRIESQLLSRLAVNGQGKFARFIGMDDAAVTRMKYAIGNQKHSFFELMSLALVFMEIHFPESQLEERLERLERLFGRKKSPAATEDSSQIKIDF